MSDRTTEAEIPGIAGAIAAIEKINGVRTFQSSDGSQRCSDCHLNMDLCTCVSTHPLRQIFTAIAKAEGQS